LLSYAALVSFPHEWVQWAVNELCIRYTHATVYKSSAAIALGEVALITLCLLWCVRRKPQRGIVSALWFLTLALIVGAWRAFTANNLELVHYPQYFPEGVLLLGMTLSPLEALSWIAVLGGLDEANQYWRLSNGRPTLFDFNDIFMDLLGGAAGVIFAMGFLYCARKSPAPGQWLRTLKKPGVIALLSVIAAGLLLWASGLMLLVEDKANTHYWFALGRFRAPSFWFQVLTNGPYKYHTLTPLEGILLLLAGIAFYAAVLRKWVISCVTR
jgi:hypothetical protein